VSAMADKLIGDVIALDVAHARRIVGSQYVITRIKQKKSWKSANALKMWSVYGHKRK
jgi:hypothetical protein